MVFGEFIRIFIFNYYGLPAHNRLNGKIIKKNCSLEDFFAHFCREFLIILKQY